MMGRLAEIELRLVSLLELLSVLGLCMHACMAAACVVFLWDVGCDHAVCVLRRCTDGRSLFGRSGVCGAVWLHWAGRVSWTCMLVCGYACVVLCWFGRLVHALMVVLVGFGCLHNIKRSMPNTCRNHLYCRE